MYLIDRYSREVTTKKESQYASLHNAIDLKLDIVQPLLARIGTSCSVSLRQPCRFESHDADYAKEHRRAPQKTKTEDIQWVWVQNQ